MITVKKLSQQEKDSNSKTKSLIVKKIVTEVKKIVTAKEIFTAIKEFLW